MSFAIGQAHILSYARVREVYAFGWYSVSNTLYALLHHGRYGAENSAVEQTA
jgi:hypothetical protein